MGAVRRTRPDDAVFLPELAVDLADRVAKTVKEDDVLFRDPDAPAPGRTATLTLGRAF